MTDGGAAGLGRCVSDAGDRETIPAYAVRSDQKGTQNRAAYVERGLSHLASTGHAKKEGSICRSLNHSLVVLAH